MNPNVTCHDIARSECSEIPMPRAVKMRKFFEAQENFQLFILYMRAQIAILLMLKRNTIPEQKGTVSIIPELVFV